MGSDRDKELRARVEQIAKPKAIGCAVVLAVVLAVLLAWLLGFFTWLQS